MRFKLLTQSQLRGVKIDWTSPVVLTDDLRAAMAPSDVEEMEAGVTLKGIAVAGVTYPRGTLVFRLGNGHEHFVLEPTEAMVVVAAPDVRASWSVERTGTVERYRGTLGTCDQGERIDVILAGSIPELSRAKVQRLIEDGHVRIGGQPATKSNLRMRAGDSVEVEIELSVVN